MPGVGCRIQGWCWVWGFVDGDVTCVEKEGHVRVERAGLCFKVESLGFRV